MAIFDNFDEGGISEGSIAVLWSLLWHKILGLSTKLSLIYGRLTVLAIYNAGYGEIANRPTIIDLKASYPS
jgi:hypothetical protein